MMIKYLASIIFVLLATVAVTAAAESRSDVTGLWQSEFYGNKVECHLEERGQFLYGVVYVNTRTGERNTYHVAGMINGNHVRAQHGGGNYFEGEIAGDTASGTFHMKGCPPLAMKAERVKRGKTTPGGLEWPAGFPPAQ